MVNVTSQDFCGGQIAPDNSQAALKRLYGLERLFAAQPDYGKRYATSIEQYVNLGYARCLEALELQVKSGKTWYLPHHEAELEY